MWERRVSWTHCVRQLEDWGKLLGDVPTATAILDRFLHHAEIINVTGDSYRLSDRKRAGGPNGAKAPTGSDAEEKSNDGTNQ